MTIGCPDCGTLQTLPPLPRGCEAACPTCGGVLEKTRGRSEAGALAAAVATLLLLFPANIFPLIAMHVMGIERQNVTAAGIERLWSQGWVILAGFPFLAILLLPGVRAALLIAVLLAVRTASPPSWAGRVFRWVRSLDVWAMLDVYLLAGCVGFFRLIHIGEARVGIALGGACYIAAALLSMLSRAAVDARALWRRLGPEAPEDLEGPLLSCTHCDRVDTVEMEGRPCPRCGARLHIRKPASMSLTAPLLFAALLLAIPANVLPMNVATRLGRHVGYTIFTGIYDLFKAGLYPLGVVIFCTSILIPIGKILFLLWCVASARFGYCEHLVFRTRIYKTIAELGRWSKTDPFTIVFFVPIMNFGPLGSARADWGATAFLMMSILTMVASSTFDPRLMWDAAERKGRLPRPEPHGARGDVPAGAAAAA